MSNEQLEQKIKHHFENTPAPDPSIREQAMQAVLSEAAKVQGRSGRVSALQESARQESTLQESARQVSALQESTRQESTAQESFGRALLAPRFSNLILSQIKLTKGVVWILQASIVLVALVWIVFAGTYDTGVSAADGVGSPLAFTLASYGIASVFIAGISVAATVYGSNDSLVELNYSSHFDYRQVMLARIAIYGLGDVLALSVLIVCGASFIPLSFIEIVLCSGISFFTTCFVCMFVLTRTRGETGIIICLISTAVIAAASAYAWGWHLHAMQNIASVFWVVLIIGAAIGAGLCLRSFVAKIEAGFEYVSQEQV